MDRIIISIVSVLFIATWTAVILLFVQTQDDSLVVKNHNEVQTMTIHAKDSTSFYVLTERTSENVTTLQEMVNKRDDQGVSIDELLDFFDLETQEETAPNS